MLEGRGFRLTYLNVDSAGRIDLNVGSGHNERYCVDFAAANNEVERCILLPNWGSTQRGVLSLRWCAGRWQNRNRCRVDGNDLLSLSATSYMLRRVGALYVRSRSPRVRIMEQTVGGGQERGLRAGTLNVPGIVGLGRACEIAGASLREEGARLIALRNRLHDRIASRLDGCDLNGCEQERLPGHLSLSFSGVGGTELISGLRDIALSSGAACSSDTPVPSHVLSAMGRSDIEAQSTLRFGMGRFTLQSEVDYVADRVVGLVGRLRVGVRTMEKMNTQRKQWQFKDHWRSI